MSSPLDCSICFKLSEDPIACQKCGIIFCLLCLKNFFAPQPYECIQCSGKQFGKLPEELQKLNNQLKGTNNLNLNSLFASTPQGPQEVLRLNKACVNSIMCGQQVAKSLEEEGVCSPDCLIFMKISEQWRTRTFDKTMRSEILSAINTIKTKFRTVPQKQQILPQQGGSYGITDFKFVVAAKNITISNDNKIILSEDLYVFRSVVGDRGFQGGVHYWEILPLQMTENEMKIGVSKSNQISMDTGFSDYKTGWAYYTVGQLRNGSNSQQGTPYGVKAKNRGSIGVLLDMNEGTLSFGFDGQFLGVAYRDPELRSGPIYPAVAMLHKAGFTWRTGINAPPGYVGK